VELKPSDRIIMSKKADMDSVIIDLTLDKLKLTDAGSIQLRAVNSEGATSSTAKLTVEGEYFLNALF